jgi:malate dehydrogenase
MARLGGLVMELEDSAFPHLSGVVATADPREAFTGVDHAIFLASHRLQPGQVRRDLLIANAPLYRQHGEWLRAFAAPSIRVLVVANPVNTNALLVLRHAANLGPANVTCMSRLDHNRSRAELARALGVPVGAVTRVASWGNHAESQVPDTAHAEVAAGGARARVAARLGEAFLRGDFVEKIRQRAWAVQRARGATSALSAAAAIVDHYRAWIYGTDPGDWVSMGVAVPADGPYGVRPGVVFSFPVTVKDGAVAIVPGLELDEWTRARLAETEADLRDERALAFQVLGIAE